MSWGFGSVEGVPRLLVEVRGGNVGFAHAVTPSDGVDLAGVEEYGFAGLLYVGVSGDVSVLAGGEVLVFVGLAGGVWHSLPPFSRVRSTGTTATGLVAGY